MRITKSLAAAALALWTLHGPAASAADFSFDDPQCTSFSTSGPDANGVYSLTCNAMPQPACQLRPHPTASPVAGTPVTLVASCSGNPYGWIFAKGPSLASQAQIATCATTTSYCVDTAATAGPVVYTVLGGNANGRGPIASVTVNWQ